jgi:hypothetical protein
VLDDLGDRARQATARRLAGSVPLGGAATANLGSLLSNRFSVPGSDSQRGFDLLRQHFRERGDGVFTLVAVGDARSPRVRAEVAAAAQRAARVVKGGKAGPVLPASATVVY